MNARTIIEALLLETTLAELIAFYEKRAAELTDEVSFYFLENGLTLHVAADLLHMDLVPGLPGQDPNFDFGEHFELSDYIPHVVKALKKVGVDAGMGAAFTKTKILLGMPRHEVHVNDFQTDSLTVSLDIPRVEAALQKDPGAVATLIDAFIAKMIEAARVLKTLPLERSP